MVQAFRITWNPDEHVSPTNYGARQIVINGTVQVPGWSGSDLSYQHNGNLIELSFTCEELINAEYNIDRYAWESWINAEYGGSWSQVENLAIIIDNDIGTLFSSVRNYNDYHGDLCWQKGHWTAPLGHGEYDKEYFYNTVFEISLSAGQAIEILSIPNLYNMTLECDDGFASSSSNGSMNNNAFIGGQSDCTVIGNARIETGFYYDQTSVSNGSGPSLETPEWFDGWHWYVFSEMTNSTGWSSFPNTYTPSDFLVYFTMYYVQVYEHDSE